MKKVIIKKWIAEAKTMGFLCYGNPNKHLSYHLESLSWDFLRCKLVNFDRKYEIMEHIKIWNKESNNYKCRPVKVRIIIEDSVKG